MRLVINKNKIFNFLFITTLLTDAYCFTTLGNRNITLFYPIVFFLFFLSLVLNNKLILSSISENVFAFLMIVYMPLNYIINGGESSTLMISLILWCLYVFSYRKISVVSFYRFIQLYQSVINITVVYGIYQFFAHALNLPLADIFIDGHMSVGYNWGNDISILGLVLRRSNAIFREPSFFSQFIGVNVLIYIQHLLDNPRQKSRKEYIWLSLNILAMVLSFSGTGILILVGGFVCLLLFNNHRKIGLYIRKHKRIILVLTVVFVMVFLTPNPLRNYFFSRFAEFDSTNVESISAYIRFVKPYEATIEILKNQPWLGLGLGKTYNYSTTITGNLNNALSVALPRSFAELGIIGGVIYVCFMIKGIKKNNLKYGPYKAFLIGAYIMTFMHGTWSSEIYWLFLSAINIDIISKGENLK